MPTAEIIAIGTELLLGVIQDTNTSYIARQFRDNGIDLYRTTIIGDNAKRIAQTLKESLSRAQIVITTGGLGPTVDDPTREAVAIALNSQLEFQPELWEQILARFARFGRQATENNRRQAYIPDCAIAIENPVGTAPAFYAEIGDRVIISVPGVPREMEYLLEQVVLPYLKEKFSLKGTIKARVLHLAGVGESQIDEWIGEFETCSNPTVGLSAHAGQIDIRIAAKADSVASAEILLDDMTEKLLSRLDDHVYGIDNTTLEDVISQKLQANGWNLTLIESGLEAGLIDRLSNIASNSQQIGRMSQNGSLDELKDGISLATNQTENSVVLVASFIPGLEKQILNMIVKTPIGQFEATRSYGGPQQMGNLWAVNSTLDFLRRNI